jgi:glycosyltransferase involved in cell wall biosynthesis
MQSKLETAVKQQGLADRVEFPGYLSDKRLLTEYRKADLFVFPSILEGFGQVLVEAMATHTPPVVCDLQPMNEIVPTDELVADPRNPNALADKIEHLVVEDRVESLARTCRSHVEENYTWTAIADKYLELYQSLE